MTFREHLGEIAAPLALLGLLVCAQRCSREAEVKVDCAALEAAKGRGFLVKYHRVECDDYLIETTKEK